MKYYFRRLLKSLMPSIDSIDNGDAITRRFVVIVSLLCCGSAHSCSGSPSRPNTQVAIESTEHQTETHAEVTHVRPDSGKNKAGEFRLHTLENAIEFKETLLAHYMSYKGHDKDWYYLVSFADDDVYRLPITALPLNDLLELKKDKVEADKISPPMQFPILRRSPEFVKWSNTTQFEKE